MASITSLSNSSYNMNSIYGNRNVLSGLASGMDTESMIENAVSGIKLKIQNLVKKRTKVEWQQEAYRSIIDKAVNFNTKYTSYSSKTNLLSASFFNNAVTTAVSGTYKDKISASGKTSSDIKINAVKQMAKAATYTVSGLGGKFNGEVNGIEADKKLDLGEPKTVSSISGTLTIQYGTGGQGASFDLQFDELENIDEVKVYNADGTEKTDATKGEKLAKAINDKLSKIEYSYTENDIQETTTADKAVKAVFTGGEDGKDGKITFENLMDKNGNSVTVGGATGDLKSALNISSKDEDITVPDDLELTHPESAVDNLKGKELSVTFNGVTKKISMDDVLEAAKDKDGNITNDAFVAKLNTKLEDAFGKGKIEVKRDADGKLSLTPTGKGDTMALGGTALEALGFTGNNTNYVNTGKKLSELLGSAFFKEAHRLRAVGKVNTETMTDEAGNKVKLRTDKDGNAMKDDEGKEIYDRVNKDDKYLYNFEINDAKLNVTEDTTVESLINSINSSAETGVKVSYSKMTNEFKFTATETGANGGIKFRGLAQDLFGDPQNSGVTVKSDTLIRDILGSDYASANYGDGKFEIKIGDDSFKVAAWKGEADKGTGTTFQMLADRLNTAMKDKGYTASYDEKTNALKVTDKDGNRVEFDYGEGIAQDLFGKIEKQYTEGQDAIMDVTINGKQFKNLTRSSNSFDIDGLTVNVKGTFNVDGKNAPDKDGNAYEAITFNTTTDSDKIVETIRQFVDDYNEMATEIKNQYSTLPAQNSNGAKYEPLTAEEEEKYSESELKAYNEKAKQGILFGNTDLSSMYSKLLSAIAPGGTDGQTLREIGIGTSYSNGMTTLSLDEDKLRAALESDPDKVKNAFTKSKEGGSASDGLMTRMQNTLNTYVKTTGEPKGVLIQRAGSMKAYTSLNNNSLKSQIDNIDNQIDRWQTKMASQIDRYTTQFSRLEQLIAEMNSQSSAFMGLMGGSSGY